MSKGEGLREPLSDEEVAKGYRAELELEGFIEHRGEKLRQAREEEEVSADEQQFRGQAEQRKLQERIESLQSWIDYTGNQERTFERLCEEARAKKRRLFEDLKALKEGA